MVEQYGKFAYIYDELMQDVDYLKWANYVEEIIIENNSECKKILELACGTGNVTIPMAQKGYNIVGVDISQDMLTIAKNKSIEKNLNLLFIEQNMVELKLKEKFDTILSMCDGMNYITDINDLIQVFQNAYDVLEDEGLFVFDISSYYKIKNILGNNTFGENLDDLSYMWENYFDEESSIINMDLTFFIKDGKYYRKEEEYHVQKAYKEKEIIEELAKIGFKEIEVYDGFTFNKSKNDSERVFFKAKK